MSLVYDRLKKCANVKISVPTQTQLDSFYIVNASTSAGYSINKATNYVHIALLFKSPSSTSDYFVYNVDYDISPTSGNLTVGIFNFQLIEDNIYFRVIIGDNKTLIDKYISAKLDYKDAYVYPGKFAYVQTFARGSTTKSISMDILADQYPTQ